MHFWLPSCRRKASLLRTSGKRGNPRKEEKREVLCLVYGGFGRFRPVLKGKEAQGPEPPFNSPELNPGINPVKEELRTLPFTPVYEPVRDINGVSCQNSLLPVGINPSFSHFLLVYVPPWGYTRGKVTPREGFDDRF